MRRLCTSAKPVGIQEEVMSGEGGNADMLVEVKLRFANVLWGSKMCVLREERKMEEQA